MRRRWLALLKLNKRLIKLKNPYHDWASTSLNKRLIKKYPVDYRSNYSF